MDTRESQQQKTIAIVVKTPNQAQEDQTIEGVCLTWTVRDLKTHLTAVYPTRPAVSDQRLIYAGKLLPDYIQIKDLFRQAETNPTIHLVCPSKQEPLGARPKTKATEQPHSSSPGPMAAPATPGPSRPTPTGQAPSTPELRQRRSTAPTSPAAPAHSHTSVPTQGTPTWPAAPLTGSPHMTHPAFPTYSLYSPQQLMWLQHVYARQYYMQYQAALAAAGTVPSAPAATIGQYPPVHAQHVPVAAPLANQNPIDNLQANQNPVQDGAFINPEEANQNMRMNAQGGPVMEDEEDINRDWLDWLYTAARVGVLLMIVYFNSNLSRFLLVMGTLFLMYLHTAGWFPFRRRAQVQEPNGPQPPEVQHNEQNEIRNQNQNPGNEHADGQREDSAPAAEGQDAMTAVLVPPHRVSVMWTAWVFFKTFFSSLIPEVPQRVAN